MNFKNICFLVFTILITLSSCNKSSELTDAIPSNANMVVYFNNKSLVEKSEYDIFKNPTVQQGINIYKALLADEAKTKVLDDFLKNSNSLGLDLKGDLYMYTNYKVFGLVVGVNDAKKIKNLLSEFKLVSPEDIKNEGGVYSLSPEKGLAIAWTESILTVLFDLSSAYGQTDSTSPVNVLELAISQIKQEADKSINANKSYLEFAKTKKDISAFYSMRGLDKTPIFAQMSQIYMDVFPLKKMFEEMQGVSAGFNVSFEKGEVSTSSKYYFETSEDELKFKEYANQMTGLLKGDHLKYITSEPLLLASFNLKGEGVYNYLNAWGFLKEINENLPDSIQPEQIKDLIKNFTGDVTFALTTLKEETLKYSDYDTYTEEYFESEVSETIPQCVFFADVANSDVLMSLLKDQMRKSNTPYKELTPTTFLITQSGIDIYCGVNNNTFFVTNIKSIYDDLNNTSLKNNYADQIKDQSAIILGNLQVLRPFIENDPRLSYVLPIFNEFWEYIFSASMTDFSSKGKLDFTTKDKNSLAVFCQQIDKLLSKQSLTGF